MAGQSAASPLIRAMERADLARIVEIDTKVLGKTRPGYYEMKLEQAQKHSRAASLVAEMDGRVVGFVFGGASRWEYGMPESVGWIDTLGVDPDYQRHGVAKALFAEMARSLKAMGVDSLYTFVNRLDWKLLKFFDRLGFKAGDMTGLKLEL